MKLQYAHAEAAVFLLMCIAAGAVLGALVALILPDRSGICRLT